MLNILRKIAPQSLLNKYHFVLAKLANFIYGSPSKKMIVIGVTGTNGKSTTVNLIAKILQEAGYKVGFTTTINFGIAAKEWLNKTKMTMLGRFELQKLLRQMVDAGCRYVVIETSSQGLIQYRHLGVEYDVAVFTNLTPEHIEAHGGFENYKKAKGLLFSHLTKFPRKTVNDKEVRKLIIANADDENVNYFLSFNADKKARFSIINESEYRGRDARVMERGSTFRLGEQEFKLQILGGFNIYNALSAIATCSELGVSLERAKTALEKIKTIAGRMEYVDEGQDFKIMVDYAPEPESLRQLYKFVNNVSKNNLIHVLGSAGGGRDKPRRPILGRLAAENADYVIVTNEDPYDEDPMQIINQVAQGAEQAGKREEIDLFKILDRRDAIRKAIELAQENDFVLLTGKGAEQAIVVKGGKKIPWDEREVVKMMLKEKESGIRN